jgi:hypothetical protein
MAVAATARRASARGGAGRDRRRYGQRAGRRAAGIGAGAVTAPSGARPESAPARLRKWRRLGGGDSAGAGRNCRFPSERVPLFPPGKRHLEDR